MALEALMNLKEKHAEDLCTSCIPNLLALIFAQHMYQGGIGEGKDLNSLLEIFLTSQIDIVKKVTIKTLKMLLKDQIRTNRAQVSQEEEIPRYPIKVAASAHDDVLLKEEELVAAIKAIETSH